MSLSGDKIMHFFRELRRRKTARVALAYIVGAWLLVQVADILFDAWEAPPQYLQYLIIALTFGLVVAIVISWFFDWTPEGLEYTEDEEVPEEEIEEEAKGSVSIEMGSAHRRQVTIVNGAVELLSDGEVVTDPETMHAILPQLEQILGRAAGRYAGYRMGDSATEFEILFGYPSAHEDDAGRAVAASLNIVGEIDRIDTDDIAGASPAARLTVHSDVVVIEESDADDEPIKVVGATSRVASWLQALSAPDSVTLTGSTFGLLRDRFECESLGSHHYAPLKLDTEVYRALKLTAPAESLVAEEDLAHSVVGRESEIALLLDRWDRTIDGEGQFVVLRGEPGIGKSTLVRKIAAAGRETENATVMPMYCSPFESNRAFHPIIEYLMGPALSPEKIESDEHREQKINKLLTDSGLDLEHAGPLMATLLSLGSGDQPDLTGETFRVEMQNCLLQIFKASAERGPTMLIFEDLHWADPSTLEIISMLVSRGASPGAMCLFTSRPSLQLDWQSRSDVTSLDLQRLSRRVTRNLVNNILGDLDIPSEMVEQIATETGGNPLFAEELTKSVSESVGDLHSTGSRAKSLSQVTLPGTLQQSLASRIDNLGSAKPLLQLCSLLGREFDYQQLRAASRTENEEALQKDLRTMVNAEFLFQTGSIPDSRYVFKHILMQETAYASMLKRTRVKLHLQVAAIIEEQFPEIAERRPQIMAFHYGEGGDLARAIPYGIKATKVLLDSYANLEAIIQADAVLETLSKTPESAERGSTEITVRMMRGRALVATRGYSDEEVVENFVEALALCEQIGDPPEMFQLLVGMWMNFFISNELEHSLALARRLVRMAEKEQTPPKILQAHYCLGFSTYALGDYEKGTAELEKALAAESPDHDHASESASGDDTRTHVRIVLAHSLWHQGHMSRSLKLAEEALEMAKETGHPFARIFAGFMKCFLHMMRLEPDETAYYSKDVITLADEHSFHFFKSLGIFFNTWATLSAGTDGDETAKRERIDAMLAGMDQVFSSGAGGMCSPCTTEIAVSLVSIGALDEATEQLDKLEQRMEKSHERFYVHEIARCRGLIAAARGDKEGAEEFFNAAQRSARAAGSVTLALRATRSLADLQTEAGNDAMAKELLDSAYNDFPEPVEERASAS